MGGSIAQMKAYQRPRSSMLQTKFMQKSYSSPQGTDIAFAEDHGLLQCTKPHSGSEKCKRECHLSISTANRSCVLLGVFGDFFLAGRHLDTTEEDLSAFPREGSENVGAPDTMAGKCQERDVGILEAFVLNLAGLL
jgi:hypothetical protein